MNLDESANPPKFTEFQTTAEDLPIELLQRLERSVVDTVLEYVETEQASALIVELLAAMEREFAAQR